MHYTMHIHAIGHLLCTCIMDSTTFILVEASMVHGVTCSVQGAFMSKDRTRFVAQVNLWFIRG